MKKFLALSLSDVVINLLINVKMPTIFNIYEQDKFHAQLTSGPEYMVDNVFVLMNTDLFTNDFFLIVY